MDGMAATFGKIGKFDATKEEWTQYTERLNYFFVANGITAAEQKRAVFLTVIGPAAFKLFRNLLVQAMKQHHSPSPSEIVQRFISIAHTDNWGYKTFFLLLFSSHIMSRFA